MKLSFTHTPALYTLLSCMMMSIVIQTNAQSVSIQLRVSPVKTKSGSIMVALYDDATTFLSNDFVRVYKEPVSQTGEFSFHIAIPHTGTYALSIFHDENANGKLEKNFMGIPSEPYGFSNDAPAVFGPPKYDDAKIEVRETGQVLKIALR